MYAIAAFTFGGRLFTNSAMSFICRPRLFPRPAVDQQHQLNSVVRRLKRRPARDLGVLPVHLDRQVLLRHARRQRLSLPPSAEPSPQPAPAPLSARTKALPSAAPRMAIKTATPKLFMRIAPFEVPRLCRPIHRNSALRPYNKVRCPALQLVRKFETHLAWVPHSSRLHRDEWGLNSATSLKAYPIVTVVLISNT
jgi:hypothetical protein